MAEKDIREKEVAGMAGKDAGVSFDKMSEIYDENLEQLLGGNTEKYAEYKVEFAKQVIGNMPVLNCLDFGCGTGRSLGYLRKYFGEAVHIYGCDVSDKELAVAAAVLPEAKLFNNSDPASLKETGVEFDFVMLSCVLHHIPPKERSAWIGTILQSVKQGGGSGRV